MKVACLFFWLLLLLPLFSCSSSSSADNDRQVFIVYLGEHKGDRAFHEIEDYHHSYLLSVKDSDQDARASLLYSYKNSINGFAAVLTPDQASKLSELDEVVTVIRSDPTKYRLQTTRSWEFLGLEKDGGGDWYNEYQSYYYGMSHQGLLQRGNFGRDVVVGVLDSGVWPESESFNDEGMGPIPKSWKGGCQSGSGFNSSHCNRKLIGARYYVKGYEHRYGPLNTTIDSRSTRDLDGHGTHTASTIGGRRVLGVSSLGGFASGTAMGGAPLVRLAIYKACWAVPNESKVDGNTCFEEDMLAAIDDAIADGVNVISASIGNSKPIGYANDAIAIGALHAAKNNIVVVCAAGNSGPTPSTLSNPAPWILTVGASSLDRMFFSPVTLGNGHKIEGESATPEKLKNYHPLVYAGDVVVPGYPTDIAGQCLPNSLSTAKAKGKIVLCMRGNGTRVGKGMEVKRAGGVGFILGNSPANGAELGADAHVLPATAVSSDNAQRILNYITSTKNPTAMLVPPKTIVHTKPAPSMASFTSRGPNVIDPNILKPDITAPGMNILAAWSEGDSPTKLESDTRRVKYNLLSGTSMACPHVAAAAALLKAVHPDWSSAAIRSALMTTADQLNNKGLPITDTSGKTETPFAFGSGHLFPQKAVDPGLVYDAAYEDYIYYVCGTGIKQPDPKIKCPQRTISGYDLNYPSLQISGMNGTVTVKRTVTNVGGAFSKYFHQASPPSGFHVRIKPSVLLFNRVGQKKSFTISIEPKGGNRNTTTKGSYSFGWYNWCDGIHTVRSPIAVSL